MRFILLNLVTIFSLTAAGQFSSQPEAFLKDVDKFLGASNRSKTKEFMDVFEPNWLNNFTPEYRSKVVQTSNLIYNKRLPAFPELYNYLLSAHSFVETNQPAESFQSWHQTIDQLLESKKIKKFRDFIEVCASFFTDGTIYYSTDHIWKAEGGTYRFDFVKYNPEISFENVDLKCFVVNRKASGKENPYIDSIVVRGTTGLLQPLATKWTGRGGVVDWQKVGLDKANNYAEITDYITSLKSTKIESDSALVYTDYYDEPLYGKFSDYAKKMYREADRIYPQFLSFSKKIVRKNILPDVDYVGGFALEGADFSGVGYDSEKATVLFYRDGKPFAKASALRIKANAKGIKAKECEMVMYIAENDSITHPGLNVSYDLESLEFGRDNEGLAQAPFKNSYHQLDMYVDRLIWTKSDPNLSLMWHPLSSRKIARFESQDFFDQKVYSQIQGMNQVNPLVAIYQYQYKYDLDVVEVGKVASAMGYTTEQALPILLELSNQGFISYNKAKQEINLQPKLKKYIDARAGRSDYDNIVFTANLLEVKTQTETNPDGSLNQQAISFNAMADSLNRRKAQTSNFGSLNLSTLDFKLNEVDPIEVSPAQKVVVFPDAGSLLVKKNRDFLFSGAIMAGKMEVYLDEGAFDYEEFKLLLLNVDVALLRVSPIFGGSNKTHSYAEPL